MQSNNNNNQGSWGVGEAIHTTYEKVKDSIAPAVEKVKEWTGMEIIDNPEQIKGRAMKMNPEQAGFKQQVQRELCQNNKPQSPVQIKQEFKEHMDVMGKFEDINKDQAELKEQMQHELTENNKAIPAFDARPSVVEKVKGVFDSTTSTISSTTNTITNTASTIAGKTREVLDTPMVHDAVGVVRQVWDSTSHTIADTTGTAVEKMKEWSGMEIVDDPEYIKSKNMKLNPEQAQWKQQVQRELCEQQKELSPIQLKKGQLKDEQFTRKQKMQQELLDNSKELPAFDEKLSTMDRVKNAWGATTSTIAEKAAPAMEMVKEWSGYEKVKEFAGLTTEHNDSVQQIKDKAVQMNPEQAHMKQKMQNELRQQQKPQSPVVGKLLHQKEKQASMDEKNKEKDKLSEKQFPAKDAKLMQGKGNQQMKSNEKGNFDSNQKHSTLERSDAQTTKLA